MSLQQALERRRSVRHYGDAPIDADTVRRCLRLAQLAPAAPICSYTSSTTSPMPPC